MKRVFFFLTGMVSFSVSQAQLKEGTIYYDQKINMHKTIQDEQMKAMIPEFRTAKFILQFSDSVSMYKTVPEDEAPDPFAGGGGGRVMIRMGGAGSGDLYKNLSQSKSVQTSELGGKNFLIVDSIKQQPWKLGTETKKILGYNCHIATRKVMQPVPRRIIMGGGNTTADTTTKVAAQGKEVEVVAWYADEIVSPVGPENYGQLPGLILQLDVDNGTQVYTATEVKKTVDQKELKEPKKGKVVTRQEYTKLMMDMMSNQMPAMGGGNVRFN
ncbi:MAG: GLPGLI family protein [Sediminibacterium sp.]